MKILWFEKNMKYNLSKLFVSSFFLSVVFLFTNECSGDDMGKKQHSIEQIITISQISKGKWDNLSRKKIFFGHQSVGNNILLGINEIKEKYGQIQLNIVETKSKMEFGEAIFSHYSNIGKNDYPISKIEEFVKLMQDGLGEKLDIAFLKFCFVDFQYRTDVEAIFKKYRESIDELKILYPDMTLVHFTVPLLRKEQVGIVKSVKTFFRALMGKGKPTFFSNSHNVARNEYNILLLNHYGGKEPIFDIAGLESTYPTGKREIFSYDGNEYFAMVPEYTVDGGHLNEKGRQYIAEQLLIFLSNL
jgi:hypothetical protein